ncbi:hypothetical protein GPX89_08380 [Nocardia sp. ET3-3]|uniref:DUF5642 domain-containing protein n=1 Tax=Nocardia terrae TaxID=2675851 RepID=A0A7K1USK1_9NOCA|nr:hypothetical protein [Nocardia terrae]MVU77261.1 hypothetical protein [Nocardia terrae]
MTTWTKVRATAALATLMVLATGCGGNDKQDNHAAETSMTTTTTTMRTSSDHLLLSSNEFPTGALKIELPKESVVTGFGNSTGASDNKNAQGPVTVTPAECLGAQQDLANQLQQLMQNASFTGAQQADGTVFTEVISMTAADLGKISDVITRCAQMRLTTTVLGKQLTNTTVTIETLPLPDGVNGTGALAYRTTSQSQVGDQSMPTSSYTGYAVVDGLTVALHSQNLTGQQADESTFENLFGQAVQKVRDIQ